MGRWVAGLLAGLLVLPGTEPAPHAPRDLATPRHTRSLVSKGSLQWTEPEEHNASHTLGQFGNISLAPLGANIRAANWTGLVEQIQDPHNRSYLVSCGILFCLGLTVYGHKLLRLWLFLGGFVSVAVAFYFFAPKALAGTKVCCGEGTEKAHLLISVGLGVFAGGLALWILKVGIFLGGSCLGLFISLGLRTSLAHMDIFQSDESFALFYFGSALCGGMLALYKDRPIIIFLTAAGGAFGVFVGIGYFDDCHVTAIVTHVEQEVSSERTPDDLPECIPFHITMCVLLAVVGMAAQCGYMPCISGDGETVGPPPGTGQAVSTRRSGGLADEDLELKELLVRNYIRDEAKRHRKKEKRKATTRGRGGVTSRGARSASATAGGAAFPRSKPDPGVVGGKRKVYRKKANRVAFHTGGSDTTSSDEH